MKATSNSTLSVGLLNIPVGVCKATESQDVKLDRAGPGGGKLLRQEIEAGTGEIVKSDDVQYGVRNGDSFHAIDSDALEAINAATKIETMEIRDFMPLSDVPFDRVTGKYFLQSPAKGGSHKAYRLLKDALREERKGKAVKIPARAGIVKWTARSRQQLAVIWTSERDDCLIMNTLSFASDVREPDTAILAPNGVQISEKELEMARMLVGQMSGDGSSLDSEVDEAVAMKRELVDKALAGEMIVAPTPKAETQASDDLMAALEASLAK